MRPPIQKYPGTTLVRFDNRLGRMAVRYDAIETAYVREGAAFVGLSGGLTNDIGACECIESSNITNIDAISRSSISFLEIDSPHQDEHTMRELYI